MRIAHLILTHKNPEQLWRLIHALDHPGADCFIHVDKKQPIEPFISREQHERVFFIKERCPVYWAGYGTIQATINGFTEIIPLGYDYINVISAQDFPLKNPATFHQFIVARQGTEFISCESIDTEWQEAAPRVRKYHLINWRIPGKHRLEKLLNKILPERKFPLDHAIVGRANWFTLTSKAAGYILGFLNKHPEVVRYYKFCWGADEFIFSTILFNSPFRDQIVPNLIYVDWTGQTGGHPRILNITDYEKLIESEKFFARKFDIETDEAIITKLEEHLQQNKSY